MELPRRWRSLGALALLVAVATATVLTAVAGARRGQTAFDRLWARTLPATATVLPNQPGFDWARIRALPEVTAMSRFPVSFGFGISGFPFVNAQFPVIDASLTRSIERPVVLAGRLYNPRRADEVLVTPQFAAAFGKKPGDILTLELASVRQANSGYDGTSGKPPRGPRIQARIVGVVRSPWFSDIPGGSGGVIPSPALFAQHRANMLGTDNQVFVNALVRLAGGAGGDPAIPRRPGPGHRPARHRRMEQRRLLR